MSSLPSWSMKSRLLSKLILVFSALYQLNFIVEPTTALCLHWNFRYSWFGTLVVVASPVNLSTPEKRYSALTLFYYSHINYWIKSLATKLRNTPWQTVFLYICILFNHRCIFNFCKVCSIISSFILFILEKPGWFRD